MSGLKSQSELLDGKLPGVSGEIEIKKTICDICNPATHCGIDAYVKDGVVFKVTGSKENPRSGGKLCVKGAASRQYIYSNDRILKPLKRVGERGSDHFVPISWEDALCIIAERLTDIKDTTGPEGVVFYAGYPKWMRPYLQRLALNFGTPNYCTENSVCWMATTVAAKLNYGAWGFPEIGKTDCLLNWGRNPVWSNAPLSRKMIAAKKRGIKIIDVGPLISPSAKFADIHLRIRPGTSGALALGLAHIIIEEELYDRKFVSTYTQGFDEYQDYVMEFPPQRVQEITGVPVRSMRDAARLYATSKTAAMLCSPNTSVHHTNGVNNHRLITALAGLTGNFDREGGNYLNVAPKNRVVLRKPYMPNVGGSTPL